MLDIKEVIQENMVILELSGRIDTNTSRTAQEKILSALQKSRLVYLNLEQVDYVSSAGLRVFLIGQKTAAAKTASLRLVYVQENVRAVLDMSGFSKVLEIWDNIQ